MQQCIESTDTNDSCELCASVVCTDPRQTFYLPSIFSLGKQLCRLSESSAPHGLMLRHQLNFIQTTLVTTGAGKYRFPSRTPASSPQPPMVVPSRYGARVGYRHANAPLLRNGRAGLFYALVQTIPAASVPSFHLARRRHLVSRGQPLL